MTREEEDRRLALSTAVAQINAAFDATSAIDRAAMPEAVLGWLSRARGSLKNAGDEVDAELTALRSKERAETPEEDR